MKSRTAILLGLALAASACALTTGCAPLPPPETLVLPTAGVRMDNNGPYMCPFTQDDLLAKWIDKAKHVQVAEQSAMAAGAVAAQLLMGNRRSQFGTAAVSMHAARLAAAAARATAMKAIGGMKYIKSESDISFYSCETMAVYMYVKYSRTEHYAAALDAAFTIYPDFKQRYRRAIRGAPRKPQYRTQGKR